MTPEEVRYQHLKVQVSNKWANESSSQKKRQSMPQKNLSLRNMNERYRGAIGRSIQAAKNFSSIVDGAWHASRRESVNFGDISYR